MRRPKHLPLDAWPEADRRAFEKAYRPGDIFDDTEGPGAHLSAGTRKNIRWGYARWLGFLSERCPADLAQPPSDRITPTRLRDYIDHVESEKMRPASVANLVASLCLAAGLLAPKRDWQWLRSVAARLAARDRPQSRSNRLVSPARTLDFGLKLMDRAGDIPVDPRRTRPLQYRDGLIIALVSLWPLRRRSIAALTLDHLVCDAGGLSVALTAADTKSHRAESWRVLPQLMPYLRRYLDEIRPQLMAAGKPHKGLWASMKGCPLSGDRIYTMARARVHARFGKDVCLHDFRRAAATFVAIDAPEKLGLIPGLLHHASPEVSEQHYNLAGAMAASKRHNAMLSNLRSALRSKLR